MFTSVYDFDNELMIADDYIAQTQDQRQQVVVARSIFAFSYYKITLKEEAKLKTWLDKQGVTLDEFNNALEEAANLLVANIGVDTDDDHQRSFGL